MPEPLVWYRRNDASRFNHAQRSDLEIRARLFAAHPTLYPAQFAHWARAVVREQIPGQSAGLRWWRWFGWYVWLVARHAPAELPKTLLRPFFKNLTPQQQMYARRVAQFIGLSRTH